MQSGSEDREGAATPDTLRDLVGLSLRDEFQQDQVPGTVLWPQQPQTTLQVLGQSRKNELGTVG